MAERVRKQPRTWSQLGAVRKKPNPYEVVTSKFHYHFRREPAPFELDENSDLNQWYLKYREGSPLQVDDWESFRDPYRLTYKDYISLQSERETYVDGLVDQHEGTNAAAGLSKAWVDTLRELFVPLRFPLHVLQMNALYVGQMSPSSFITNCVNFQAADEMRRIQRVAYWTKVLANEHDETLAATATARERWEQGEHWQPLRKGLEEMLVLRDWGEAFTALNLVVKPMVDSLVNWQFAELARRNGDEFLGLLFSEYQRDSNRSLEWTRMLVSYMLEHRPELEDVLTGWQQQWQLKGEEAIAGLARFFEDAPNPASQSDVVAAVNQRYRHTLTEPTGLFAVHA